MADQLDIIYTKVDEAPELASGSFVPIIQAFTGVAGIKVGSKDIYRKMNKSIGLPLWCLEK